MAADAWFDVCTSPAGRPLAMALMDMTVETGVAVTCLLLPRMARPHAAARLARGRTMAGERQPLSVDRPSRPSACLLRASPRARLSPGSPRARLSPGSPRARRAREVRVPG